MRGRAQLSDHLNPGAVHPHDGVRADLKLYRAWGAVTVPTSDHNVVAHHQHFTVAGAQLSGELPIHKEVARCQDACVVHAHQNIVPDGQL